MTFTASSRMDETASEMKWLIWFILLCSNAEGFTNLAIGKIARQLSTYNESTASRAVDGNADPYLAGNSCSVTEVGRVSWWTVDLGREYTVYRIKITPSVDGSELRDLYVSVGTAFYYENHPVLHNGVLDTIQPEGRRGRNVYIDIAYGSTSSKTWSLTLCEVQVYGELEQYYRMDTKRVSTPELQRHNTRSKTECAHGCLAMGSCRSFIWNPTHNECLLYGEPPTSSFSDNLLGYIPV